MSEADNPMRFLADNETFERFQKAVIAELYRLGPHPRSPLTVTKASEIAEVSQNTAGKYVDIMEITKKIEVVRNPPRKDLYLPDYSSGKEGEGVE